MQGQDIMINSINSELQPFQGQPWLVEERDACGVGFIAYQDNRKSHKLVKQALKALHCMEHRGGCGADRETGDGSGIMTGIPLDIFKTWFIENNIEMPPTEEWGVGMVHLPFGPRRFSVSGHCDMFAVISFQPIFIIC